MNSYETAAANFYEAKTAEASSKPSDGSRLQDFWNDQIMERFIKANLFVISCTAAGLLLIVYLAAFSCEVSWILEAHGELPVSAYILCTQFFVVFVATTILIHGLVTGLPWGLFAWSVIIGVLSIPELVFVMIMTTQHWGLQSVHGLTELISYLIRLLINCFALICVIPTGIRWRRETRVLSQLQDLATRLQLQTPPPSVPITKQDSRRSSKRMQNLASFDNAAYQVHESGLQSAGVPFYNNNNNAIYGSQNEFNASVFAPVYGRVAQNNRAQSLMDLRCTLPGMYNPRYVLDTEDPNAKYFNITFEDLKNNIQESNKNATDGNGSVVDPIYCSIEPNQQQQQLHKQHHYHQQQQQKVQHPKLSRNCISLENLDGITKLTNELSTYGHNLLQNYEQQQYYLAMLGGYKDLSHANLYRRHDGSGMQRYPFYQPNYRRNSQLQYCNTIQYAITRNAGPPSRHANFAAGCGGFGYGNYTNPYATNSKLSLGNESDDYRKYRDVAL